MSEAFQELSASLLADGYGIRFRANGTSMLPLIGDGEVIIVEPLPARRVRRGDILLYLKGRGVIAHRVVKIEKANGEPCRFTLRGDTSATADAPVKATEILGRVCAVERDGRRIALSGYRARWRWLRRQARAQARDLVAMALVIIAGRSSD
jgi:signal peptidase I